MSDEDKTLALGQRFGKAIEAILEDVRDDPSYKGSDVMIAMLSSSANLAASALVMMPLKQRDMCLEQWVETVRERCMRQGGSLGLIKINTMGVG